MALTPTAVLVARKAAYGFVRGQIVSDVDRIAEILATDARHAFVRAVHLVEVEAEAVEATLNGKVDAAVAAGLADAEGDLNQAVETKVDTELATAEGAVNKAVATPA